MPAPPWSRPHGVEPVVRTWLRQGRVSECLAATRRTIETPARLAPFPEDLQPGIVKALGERGIESLYAHQRAAIDAARAGRHVVVATPTASGKSLCFHLPVLDRLAREPSASALYLFPTKALSRDQEHSLLDIVRDAGLGLPAMVFDGDTPGDARRAVRERARVVLTNPDMLHSGILPNHAKWAATFQGLRYVVLDELHTYRGVFGSHMAHVIARLRRIARFHGSDPTFVCATATIGNPREHAARILGVSPESVELVSESGAPAAPRELLLYNPPIVNAELGVRGSSLKHGVELAADLVRAEVPTIVFGQSRNSVEVMLKYLRDAVPDAAKKNRIMGYRGGYLPDTRRKIEQDLRSGEILCVVATNALELGIDIGDLDAVVCVGFPGSIAATWQRFGRAGRRGETSICVLVCSSHAVDQYFAREPSALFEGGIEEARIDPDNVEVLIQHLKCAAFEAPFETSGASDPAKTESYLGLDSESTREALDYLAGHGLVHESGGRFHWAGDPFPATSVSLRSIGWDNFVIVDEKTGESLAELDWRASHTMLHEQAIYQHDAEQYQVERLDYENHKAFVRKVEPDYFTTALTYRTVEVIEEHERGRIGSSPTGFGDVKVIEKVTGYKKIKFFTHENAGYGDVHLPEIQMHTTCFWLTLPETMVQRIDLPRAAIVDGLRGVGAALETVSAIALLCDPRDLGRTLGDGEEGPGGGEREALTPTRATGRPTPEGVKRVEGGGGTEPPTGKTKDSGDLRPAGRNPHAGRTGGFDPTVFLFDAHPGGVGLARRIFERAPELLDRARTLVSRCPCSSGCPACVGPSEDGGSARKSTALVLLDEISKPERRAAAGRATAQATT